MQPASARDFHFDSPSSPDLASEDFEPANIGDANNDNVELVSNISIGLAVMTVVFLISIYAFTGLPVCTAGDQSTAIAIGNVIKLAGC